MMRRFILMALCFGSLIANDVPLSDPPLKSAEETVVERFQDPEGISFTPPADWQFADPKELPSHVKVMAVGKGKGEYPPSINLGYDTFDGSLKDYLKMIKRLNKEEGAETKDLGKVKTHAGSAALIQVDGKTKWGPERQLQAILIYNGKAWILTCSALKKEFSNHYKTFFDAIRSLKVNKPS